MPTEGSNRPNKASISSEVLQRQVRGRSSTSSWAPGTAGRLGQRVDRIHAVLEMNGAQRVGDRFRAGMQNHFPRSERLYGVDEPSDLLHDRRAQRIVGELMSQARPNGRCTDQTVSPTCSASARKRSMAASRSSVDFPRSELSVTSTWPNPASLTCCNLSAGGQRYRQPLGPAAIGFERTAALRSASRRHGGQEQGYDPFYDVFHKSVRFRVGDFRDS